jgi:hypothetical protein
VKESGVNLENPPDSNQFKPLSQNENDSDIELMKARCFNRSQQPITVNLTGLADLVHGDPTSCSSHPPLQDVTNTSQNSSKYPDLPPKITMAVFCKQYGISDDICTKLIDAKYTVPHTFAGITDKELMEDAELRCGKVADLRDGET